MKAIRVHKFGGPEVLKLDDGVAVPKCGDNDVLIKVMAAGVNPIDVYVRSGAFNAPPLPYIPGGDCAGIVVQAGSKVTKFKVGDRVWTCRSAIGGGTYAEYAAFDTTIGVNVLPAAINFSQGAALGVPYLTAYRALFTKAHGKPGQTVLIHGASGAVGIAAVQIARAFGFVVLGTAGTPEGCKFVEKNGAHKAFNHKEADYVDKIMAATNKEGVDIVIEMVANANLKKDVAMLKTFGHVVVIGSHGPVDGFAPGDLMMKEASVCGLLLLVAPASDWKESGAALVAGMEDGWLRPAIEKAYPLDAADQVHKDIMGSTGRTGKLVLDVAGSCDLKL